MKPHIEALEYTNTGKKQYGDYIRQDGLVYGNEEVIGEVLLLLKDQMEQSMEVANETLGDYIVEYIVKQSWVNANGIEGNTRLDDEAKPYFTVAWKATKKQ